MAIKDTNVTSFKKPSLPVMSSEQHEEFLSPEKAARVLLKTRFAGLICKAQQVLQEKGKASDDHRDQDIVSWRDDDYEEPEKLKKIEMTPSRREVDRVQRVTSVGVDQLKTKKLREEEVRAQTSEERDDQLVIKSLQEEQERRREADHSNYLRTKKNQEIDLQREAEDDLRYLKKKRHFEGIEIQREGDRGLRRR
ncbi:hypothetical protein L484_001305 [Morus notabilis]|uniref:Uncharacterized protein n=1 Tax=Morus notabilis TaxID=981085 RepID=W9SEY5_9ROSA|nr:hypothetical protein L484_001305 [Morus notabilis]